MNREHTVPVTVPKDELRGFSFSGFAQKVFPKIQDDIIHTIFQTFHMPIS